MKKIIVIDDFYRDPSLVRETALRAEYMDVRDLNYPGYQSVRSFASESLKSAFAREVGESLEINPAKLTFGKFRVMLEATGSRLKIHVDGAADWTGLVYLNAVEQCRGGTAFYKHRETGLDGLPTREEAASLGFRDLSEFEKSVVERDTLISAAWEQTAYVGMRFNRLVLFRGGELFHCHTCSWGSDIRSGRLTQNFFFNSATNPSHTDWTDMVSES